MKMNVDSDVQYAFTPAIPGHFFKNYCMTASSRWMIRVPTPMRSLLVRCTTSLAAALTLASYGIHFLYADNAPEIPQQAMKLNQRGLSHLHKKEYDQAIASFREALQIQPEYPDALDNLGKALDATGKDAEAMADFDKAIKIAPNNAAAYADRGMALFHEGKYEEAAASYRQAIVSGRYSFTFRRL